MAGVAYKLVQDFAVGSQVINEGRVGVRLSPSAADADRKVDARGLVNGHRSGIIYADQILDLGRRQMPG